MTVIRRAHDGVYPYNEHRYETELTDIREIAGVFGQTDDTLELYNDEGELVAVATWPMGYKVYKYAYGPDLMHMLREGPAAYRF